MKIKLSGPISRTIFVSIAVIKSMSNRTLSLIFKEPSRTAGYVDKGENAFHADSLEMLEID